MHVLPCVLTALVCLVGAPAASLAGDILTDIRLGVLAHDVPILGDQHEHGVDLNAEAIFASPVPEGAVADVAPAWRWLLRPAPNVGISANLNGYTSQIYVGVVWTADLDTGGWLWPDHAVFLAIGFGPAFNNGHVSSASGNQLSLGSNVLFHESLELGYRITPVWSASIYFEHSSNAGLSTYNDGLDNLGVRLGLHF